EEAEQCRAENRAEHDPRRALDEPRAALQHHVLENFEVRTLLRHGHPRDGCSNRATDSEKSPDAAECRSARRYSGQGGCAARMFRGGASVRRARRGVSLPRATSGRNDSRHEVAGLMQHVSRNSTEHRSGSRRSERRAGQISSPMRFDNSWICDVKPIASSMSTWNAIPEPGSPSNWPASAIRSRIRRLKCSSTTKKMMSR